MNYYNEIEPFAVEWLRNLIDAGLIPSGHVDNRSIEDVTPNDLRGYTQCHFFAGIGGWPLALALAGWPADREVWTGSCPCQPFSVAGKGMGTADQRHLWPAWFHLIRLCKPAVVFGEQVAAAVGHAWLDGVCADMEGQGYAIGAAVLPACAAGAPHRRDRLWFGATPKRYLRGNLNLNLAGVATTALWPTPTSLAPAKDGNNEAGNSAGLVAIRGHTMAGLSDTTAKPGALNPQFVCWLMGYPAAWDACAPTATRSSRKGRLNS